VAVCAFEAITVPWLMLEIWPQLTGPELYKIGDRSVHLGELLIAFGATAALTWLQLSGAQLTARVQDLMVVAMILCAVGFIGGAINTGHVANLQPVFVDNPSGFIGLLLMTPLFYAGFGAVPQALGESSPAALKRIPLIVFLVIIAAILFHVVVIAATALVLAPSELSSPLPAALAFQKAFQSPVMASGALIIGLLGLLTTWNAVYYSASRIMFALGHGRLGPQVLAQTSRNGGAPVVAIGLVGILSAAAIPYGKELLYPVLSLGGLCVTTVFLLVALSCLRARLIRRRAATVLVWDYRLSVSQLHSGYWA
jgi:basic amino acid/polyamine antiporter, APA family